MPRHNTGPYLGLTAAGFYEIRWTEEGRSKRGSTGTKDLGAAQEALREFLTRDQQQAAGQYPTDMIVDTYLSEHVNAEGSDVVDRARVKYGLTPIKLFFGSKDIGAITKEDCKEYARQRRSGEIGNGRRVSDTTINYEILMLSVAANYAMENKRLPLDRAPILWRPQKALPRNTWVQHDDYYRIMRSVPVRTRGKRPRFTRLFLFLMVAFNTAARRASIETLLWTQVDFERRLIDFNPAGRRQTAKRRPIVPMNAKLRAVLAKAYQERQGDLYVLGGKGSIRHAFDTAMERAGFGWVTRHTIRRTWVTWAFQRGVSKYDAADVTGDDPETLEKHYRQYRPEWLQGAVAGGAADGAQSRALRPNRGTSPSTNDGQGW